MFYIKAFLGSSDSLKLGLKLSLDTEIERIDIDAQMKVGAKAQGDLGCCCELNNTQDL